MIAFRNGERAGCTHLLGACAPIVRRIAQRAGAPADCLDDVVQETLMAIHAAHRAYDPSRSFLAWLTAIAQRRTIDALRRQHRRQRWETHLLAAHEAHADPRADASRGWSDAARARQVARALATLTACQRQAVEVIVLEDRCLAEAAAVTGRSKGALKVSFHRALDALQARCDE